MIRSSRRFYVFFALSLVAHATVLFVWARESFISTSAVSLNESVKVRVVDGATLAKIGKAPLAQGPVAKRPLRSAPKPSLKSLFSLAPREAARPSAKVTERSAEESRLSEWIAPTNSMSGVFGAGKLGVGHRAATPMERLAKKLDETYTFPYLLGKEGISGGSVEIHFSLDSSGKLDPKRVRASGSQRYLLVYALQNLEQTLAQADLRLSATDLQTPVYLVLHFSSGRKPYHESPGDNAINDRTIFLSRYYKMNSSLDLGIAEFMLSKGHGNVPEKRDDPEELRPSLSIALEPESWFSASHRKKYGWDGQKVARSETAALKIAYEGLYKNYVERGWILQ